MSLWPVVTGCIFAAALAALVALIDRWREARLTRRSVKRARVPLVSVPPVPAAPKRAA